MEDDEDDEELRADESPPLRFRFPEDAGTEGKKGQVEDHGICHRWEVGGIGLTGAVEWRAGQGHVGHGQGLRGARRARAWTVVLHDGRVFVEGAVLLTSRGIVHLDRHH